MMKILQLPVLVAFWLSAIFWLGNFQIHAQNINPNQDTNSSPQQILVFTKTTGWRHSSIEAGVKAIKKLGEEQHFQVTQTEDAFSFHPENLKKYQLVLFLSTTEEVLNESQQKAFEDYIKNGGAYMGIHAAADTEYQWPFYNKLVGAYFESHPNNPNVLQATLSTTDSSHPATAHLPAQFQRTDEWYNYKNIQPHIQVLLHLEESSYKGGTQGEEHPIAWYHDNLGGRAFYTGGGHTEASFEEPDFLKHLLGGIEYCLGRK